MGVGVLECCIWEECAIPSLLSRPKLGSQFRQGQVSMCVERGKLTGLEHLLPPYLNSRGILSILFFFLGNPNRGSRSLSVPSNLPLKPFVLESEPQASPGVTFLPHCPLFRGRAGTLERLPHPWGHSSRQDCG